MPIYEYQCEECGEEFEELVRTNPPEIECPECGSERVKKLLAAFGFRIGGCSSGTCDLKGRPR